MNVFVADHPLVSDRPCLGRRVFAAACLLPMYFILLGPLYCPEGRGYLDFAPAGFRRAMFLPTVPFFLCLGPDNFMAVSLMPRPALTVTV